MFCGASQLHRGWVIITGASALLKNTILWGKLMRFAYSRVSAAVMACMLTTPAFSAEEISGNKNVKEEMERIDITGSRIQRSSAATPVPTTVLDASAIEQLGFSNTGDILNSLPAISGSLGARSGTGGTGDENAGLELANLRGLGVDRTLVLINGRRHVGSSLSNTSVDVGSIPVQMIERVEVITGAAGAVYGADAVSGVVNFIMKKSYEGFKADIQYGQTAESDGEEVTFSLLGGASFANGAGNVMASLDYTDRKSIHSLDRPWSASELGWRNAENYTPGSGLPQKRLGSEIGFNPLSKEGYVSQWGWHTTNIGALPTQTFNSDGTNRDFDPGYCQGGGIICEGGDSYTTRPYDLLSTPTERIIASIVTNFALSDEHEIFADAKYSSVTGNNTYQGGLAEGYYGPLANIQRNNPYLARYTDITTAMDNAGIDSVFVNKAYDSFDNTIENTFETFQVVVGANGYLTESIGYDFTVQYGQTDVELKQHSFYVDRFIQGINTIDDGNGNAVCSDSSNGCQPINPFGYKSVSPEAAAWVRDDLAQKGKLTQTVATFSLNGDLFDLPAGSLQFAAGMEYRKEESESTPDYELTQETQDGHGLVGLTYGGVMQDVSGEYDVAEIFGELLIPVVSDAFFVQDLTVEVAARYSDYSTVGGQTAYKFGLDWVITDEVRLRGSYGLAVRAPNIGELYQPEVTSFAKVQDPCSSSFINTGPNTDVRKANCSAVGIPEGWTAFSEGGEAPILNSGNAELDAEDSTTSSFGVVFTPTTGLSIAFDYWSIEIDQAISSPSTSEILNNCYDFADMVSNPFCTLSSRNADDHELSGIKNKKVNVAALSANGYDLEMNYQVDLASGSLLFNVVGTYYDQRDQLLNAKKPDEVLEGVGIIDNPKARGYFSSTYRQDSWNANLIFNYIGSSKISATNSADPVYPRNHIDSVVYANFRAAYSFTDNVEVYGGVNNLMNKGPERIPALQMGSNIYDGIGRAYYLGLNYEF